MILELQNSVRHMVASGADWTDVEAELIDTAPLPPDGRDALWLYGWALAERRDEAALARRLRCGRFISSDSGE